MDFVDSTCYTKSIGYVQYFMSYFVVFVYLGESLFFFISLTLYVVF